MPSKMPASGSASWILLLWIIIKQLPKLVHSPRLFKRTYMRAWLLALFLLVGYFALSQIPEALAVAQKYYSTIFDRTNIIRLL